MVSTGTGDGGDDATAVVVVDVGDVDFAGDIVGAGDGTGGEVVKADGCSGNFCGCCGGDCGARDGDVTVVTDGDVALTAGVAVLAIAGAVVVVVGCVIVGNGGGNDLSPTHVTVFSPCPCALALTPAIVMAASSAASLSLCA